MGNAWTDARLRQWRGKWYVFYTDYAVQPPQARRVSCEAEKAKTHEARLLLVKRYRLTEKTDCVEVVKRGGRLDYEHNLLDALRLFREDVDRRLVTRRENPAARGGLAESSGKHFQLTLDLFEDWLKARGKVRLTTGDLDGGLLSRFIDYLAIEPSRHGDRTVKRSAATLNKHRRTLHTALNWLNDLRPPMFPDFQLFRKALKSTRVDHPEVRAFAPSVLTKFLATALERERPDRSVTVLRPKLGKTEKYEQGIAVQAATPVSKLFLLVALTGCRVGEALALRWEDVDLVRGRITIRAQKTGRTRIVPLVGAPEGEVAPEFLKLLRVWRFKAGDDAFVLPHTGLPAPQFPQGAWYATVEAAGLERFGPQRLRQNFTSYAASYGIPTAVAALWQGHSAMVAERFYRAQVLDRYSGRSLEDALGLKTPILALLGRPVEAELVANGAG